LERNLSQAQLAEQAGISKRTLERLEAGAAATQLSLFLRVLRQLDLLERLELLLPDPQPSPLALLEQQRATRKRASRPRTTKPASTWSWGQPGPWRPWNSGARASVRWPSASPTVSPPLNSSLRSWPAVFSWLL
jgi:transcriptional regulator with XRE-family HTH domain